jgi:hypothetical protein
MIVQATTKRFIRLVVSKKCWLPITLDPPQTIHITCTKKRRKVVEFPRGPIRYARYT